MVDRRNLFYKPVMAEVLLVNGCKERVSCDIETLGDYESDPSVRSIKVIPRNNYKGLGPGDLGEITD